MARNQTIHVRVNEDVKRRAEDTLEVLGLSVSDAVNLFLCQVGLVGGLPFEVRLPAPARVTVNSNAEIMQKLQTSEDDILQGRVSSADEVFDRIEDKYDL